MPQLVFDVYVEGTADISRATCTFYEPLGDPLVKSDEDPGISSEASLHLDYSGFHFRAEAHIFPRLPGSPPRGKLTRRKHVDFTVPP